MTSFDKPLKLLVWHRDGGQCCRCGVAVWDGDIHHRKSRKMGGANAREEWINSAGNLMLLCRDCHDWIEAEPDDARAAGYRLDVHQLPDDVLFYSEHDRMWWHIYERGGTFWRDPYSGLLAPYRHVEPQTYAVLSGHARSR